MTGPAILMKTNYSMKRVDMPVNFLDDALLEKVAVAIQIIQANGYDLAYNLKTSEYEVVAKGDLGCILETFNDYQKIIDYAQTLPIQED